MVVVDLVYYTSEELDLTNPKTFRQIDRYQDRYIIDRQIPRQLDRQITNLYKKYKKKHSYIYRETKWQIKQNKQKQTERRTDRMSINHNDIQINCYIISSTKNQDRLKTFNRCSDPKTRMTTSISSETRRNQTSILILSRENHVSL